MLPSTESATVDMRYVVFSGHPKNNETSQIEVIDDHGSIHICQSNSRYPLNVNNARSVFTNDRMIVCGGRMAQTQDHR